MANHKSALKRNRQNNRKRIRNRAARSAVRAAVKAARTAVEQRDPKAAELVRTAERLVAKAASKDLYHRKNASRKISRLSSALAASSA